MPRKVVEYINFNKDDLKSGMIAETRNGELYLVFADTGLSSGISSPALVSSHVLAAISEKGFFQHEWVSLTSYDHDLTKPSNRDYDIVTVYSAKIAANIGTPSDYETIWERPEPQEMTQAQVEEALGYKIKLVTDSNTTYKEPTA